MSTSQNTSPANQRPDLSRVVEDALDAFWESVAGHYPQAKTGDLSPETTIALDVQAERAVKEWVDGNVPETLSPHPKVPHGLCPVCGHYRDDCTGTSSAHSTGPFEVFVSPGGQLYIAQVGKDGAQRKHLCVLTLDDAPEENAANARLLAAAPDQHAALEAIRNDCQAWLDQDMDIDAVDLLTATRNAADIALAKARGDAS